MTNPEEYLVIIIFEKNQFSQLEKHKEKMCATQTALKY